MTGLLDLHRAAPAIGLSDRERGIALDALRRRKADLVWERRQHDRNKAPGPRDAVARQILELDLLRVKLGDEVGPR